MAAEFIQILAKRQFAAAQHQHRVVFAPLAQRAGEKFANHNGRAQLAVVPEIPHTVAADIQHPPYQIPVGQQGVHRQVLRRVFAARRIPANRAGFGVVGQRVHAAHTQFIRHGDRPTFSLFEIREHTRFILQFFRSNVNRAAPHGAFFDYPWRFAALIWRISRPKKAIGSYAPKMREAVCSP